MQLRACLTQCHAKLAQWLAAPVPDLDGTEAGIRRGPDAIGERWPVVAKRRLEAEAEVDHARTFSTTALPAVSAATGSAAASSSSRTRSRPGVLSMASDQAVQS